MKRAFLISIVLFLPNIVLAGQLSAPKVLIVPIKKGETADSPSVSIGNYLAQEFDQDGRVRPIVWSITDPTFRDAEMNGVLKGVKDSPSKPGSMVAAKELGATYVLLYSSHSSANGYVSQADLYLNGREVWHDSQNSGAKRSGALNSEDSNASIAHTWHLLLLGTAFKALIAHPKMVPPVLEKGQEPPAKLVSLEVAPTDVPAMISAKADEYIKAGHQDKAINLVRDAIDAKPFNPALRLLLVSLYEQDKDWSDAADAAIRGREVIPDNLDLRKASLRDLITAGRAKDAQNELNEILAREPNSSSTKLLESQTYLAVGDYAKATLSLDQVVKKFPSSDCYFWRSLARAAMGGADGVNADVQEYLKKPFSPAQIAESGQESEKILVRVTNRDISSSLILFQQATIHPDLATNKDQLDQLVSGATARSNFLQQVPCAPLNKQSYGQLLLAQKLLIASFASLRDVLKTASDDSMTDARINLGEAIKAVKNSQKLLEGEQGINEVVKPSVDLP